MKFNPWYLVSAIPLALLATRVEYGAQLAVLGVTMGIFFGTVSLQRPTASDATSTNH